MPSTILVTGASGNLGSKVAHELIAAGVAVKVTGRSREKLAPFEGKAAILCGDLEDAAFLHSALEGVTGVFLVMPQLYNRSVADFAHLFLGAAATKGVTHVVNISNCTLKRYNQWTTLLEFEQALNAPSPIHLKHLQCANFFENLNWGIHTPYHPDIKLPYISSYEIAHVAATYLQHPNFRDQSVEELMGEQDYSMQELAQKLGIAYQQQPLTEANRWFYEAFNTGQYELVKRTAENTSRLTEERFSLEYFLAHDFQRAAVLPS